MDGANDMFTEDEGAQTEEVESVPARPPTKQKKSDKAYAKHEALLASMYFVSSSNILYGQC